MPPLPTVRLRRTPAEVRPDHDTRHGPAARRTVGRRPVVREDRYAAAMAAAGHSSTPLARKLGLRPGAALALVHAPDDIDELLAPLPDGVRIRRIARGRVDVAVAFFVRARRLEREIARLRDLIATDGGLWLAWPKRSSGVATDLAFDVVQRVGLAAGLVDNKVAAINDTWSGLRFVVRVADR